MRIHIMDLQPGDMLTKDVFNTYGLHVLSAQTVLSSESIAKLLSHHIDYVDAEHTASLSVPSSPDSNSGGDSLTVQVAFETSIAGVKMLFEQSLVESKIDPFVVDASFEPLADSFQQESNLVDLMLSLTSEDDYTYQHSVQVGILSYYISKWLGHSQQQALLTGKAGFVHDIGKSKIDPKILFKPSKLTDDEFEIMKKHTVLGKEILEKTYSKDSPLVIGAIQHHERLDGKGYPYGLKSPEIDPLAKIIAVADIYSAMICSRVYQKERDMLFVLQELHRVSFGEIDPHITQVFIRNMIPNFLGKTVVLTSGERGTIVLTNPSDFFRPLIQLDNNFIDLTKRTDLVIHKILI